MRTVTAPAGAPFASPAAARILAADHDDVARFTPGSVVAGRYRVIGLLGRGGMGEVYRADDLKLGQAVALKFLPRAVASDPARLERFLGEVRLARQVSHPNVCRVYDIAELDGQPFLSMEYVDGEDLRSLLQRIGRLPAGKALDIARQLAAGLAAAHDRGVLHRDLKPANVMLDGRGRVRITDFGLAVAADSARLHTDLSGTPAYMAPEQLAGQAASVQSDIYALGLLLYEIYTGRRAFTAASLADLAARAGGELPAPPSTVAPDIDPAVERLILRATARDPRSRPASALEVAALLPGGSPLDAALRAGETPSPEMVAVSGSREGLEPAVAWVLLALAVAGAVAATLLASRWILWRIATPERPPQVLADAARRMLESLGHQGASVDRASGFEADLEHLRYLQRQDPAGWRTRAPQPSVLRFWYRESPRPLEAWRFPLQYGNVSRITPADPPHDLAGMALVRLDPEGRLTHLVVVPGAADASRAPAPAPDWVALLGRAGFEPPVWHEDVPQRVPPVYADARVAWTGTWPGRPDVPVRLEAAAVGGRPVYFEAVFPWTPASHSASEVLTPTQRASIAALLVAVAVTVVAAAAFARRHVRAGRGDRRGAARLSAFVFMAMMVSWLFGESHVATLWEVTLVAMALAWAVMAAGFCWLSYLAVEPFIRRHWPDTLVSWTRVLRGELRDPLVGRDVLVGATAGTLLAALGVTSMALPARLGLPTDIVFADVYGVAYGIQTVVPLLVWRAAQGVLAALACLFLLVLLRLVLRTRMGAVVAFVAGGSIIAGIGASHFGVGVVNTGMLLLVFALLLVRFGLLAAVTQFYVWGLFIFFPVTWDLSAWYAGSGVTPLVVFAALAAFGFTAALAGRPALGRAAVP